MKRLTIIIIFISLIIVSCSGIKSVKDKKSQREIKITQTGDHTCDLDGCYSCHGLKTATPRYNYERIPIDSIKKPNIICAAIAGDTNKVKNQIDAGVDVNYIDSWGLSALSGAASKGFTEIVDLLLEAGADVNIAIPMETTLLIFSVRYDNPDIVKSLINAGADLNAKNSEGMTALSLAKEKGYKEIIKLLKEAGAKE